jgi:2-hydroxychromene-2-carboxylate isomerase
MPTCDFIYTQYLVTSAQSDTTSSHDVIDFYIDPGCPWAWRGSRWMVEVSRHLPLSIAWRTFSLKLINRGRDHPRTEFHSLGLAALRVLCLIRRESGHDGFERFYSEIGRAAHDQGLDLSSGLLMEALDRAGFDSSMMEAANADPTTLSEVEEEHETAVSKVGAFGVPTILLSNGKGIFGPVLDDVPTGDSAVHLWAQVHDMINRDEFYELKRRRR